LGPIYALPWGTHFQFLLSSKRMIIEKLNE